MFRAAIEQASCESARGVRVAVREKPDRREHVVGVHHDLWVLGQLPPAGLTGVRANAPGEDPGGEK